MKSVFPWKMEGAGVSLPSAWLRLPPRSNRLCLALAPPHPGSRAALGAAGPGGRLPAGLGCSLARPEWKESTGCVPAQVQPRWMRDKSGGGSGFTAPVRGFSVGGGGAQRSIPGTAGSGGAGQGAAATCAGRVWAEIGGFGSLPGEGGEGAREGGRGAAGRYHPSGGAGAQPRIPFRILPRTPLGTPSRAAQGAGGRRGRGGFRGPVPPSLPAGRRRGAAGAGALSPCRRVARSGGGPWRWRRSGDGGGAAAVSPAGSGAERGAGRSGAAPLGPMAFSAWQILSPVQWARWTWSAVRGGGGPEGEDGGAEEDSPALGSRQVTAAPAPIPPVPPPRVPVLVARCPLAACPQLGCPGAAAAPRLGSGGGGAGGQSGLCPPGKMPAGSRQQHRDAVPALARGSAPERRGRRRWWMLSQPGRGRREATPEARPRGGLGAWGGCSRCCFTCSPFSIC